MKNIMILIMSITVACNNATADNDEVVSNDAKAGSIKIGILSYGGNGCPDGSVVIQGDAENNSLNLQFDQYTTVAGGGEGQLARKSCNIAIPVSVPQGFQVGIIAADYQGYVSLPRGAQAQINAEYFLAGGEGVLYNESYLGEVSEEVNIHHESPDGAIVWTPCGADTNIRVNTNVLVRTNDSDDEAMMSLDQASLIQLVLRECSSSVLADQLRIDI